MKMAGSLPMQFGSKDCFQSLLSGNSESFSEADGSHRFGRSRVTMNRWRCFSINTVHDAG
jgi:hypothetical protein